MISRRSLYKFNTETLEFVEVNNPVGRRLLKFLSLFLLANLTAFIIALIVISLPISPEDNFHSHRINRYSEDLNLLLTKADSLNEILHNVCFINDINYRNILEMDSIPFNVRHAGTGGSETYYRFNTGLSAEKIPLLFQKIERLKAQLKVQNESYNDILKTAIDKKDLLDHYPAITPVNIDNRIWISSYFGTRHDPFTFLKKTHKGIDFVGPYKTNIYATADGTVTLAKHSRKGYGNEVVIDHGYGYSTRYAHMSSILVEEGKPVKRGQLIGLMGNTGRSTGTHLHYEVRFHNRPVNPIYFFADDVTPEEFEELTNNYN